MKSGKSLFFLIVALFLVYLPGVLAQEGDDLEVFGLELEKLMNLGSGILATALFALTLIAYKRTNSKRLLYVSAAFLLFAVKSFLMSTELFFGDWSASIDPIASFLDFAILLSFFFGIIKK